METSHSQKLVPLASQKEVLRHVMINMEHLGIIFSNLKVENVVAGFEITPAHEIKTDIEPEVEVVIKQETPEPTDFEVLQKNLELITLNILTQ